LGFHHTRKKRRKKLISEYAVLPLENLTMIGLYVPWKLTILVCGAGVLDSEWSKNE